MPRSSTQPNLIDQVVLFRGPFSCIPNLKICRLPVHIGSFRKRCGARGCRKTNKFASHFDLTCYNHETELFSPRSSWRSPDSQQHLGATRREATRVCAHRNRESTGSTSSVNNRLSFLDFLPIVVSGFLGVGRTYLEAGLYFCAEVRLFCRPFVAQRKADNRLGEKLVRA